MTSLTFYGGVNEIGGNKILLEDKDTRIFLDFGMSFSRKEKYFEQFLSPRTANGILWVVCAIGQGDGLYGADCRRHRDGVERKPKHGAWDRRRFLPRRIGSDADGPRAV